MAAPSTDDPAPPEAMSEERLYPPVSGLHSLEPYYSRHVAAMTREGLHAKSDIAAQLALRDQEIAAKQRGYDALHEMLDAAGVGAKWDVWTRVDSLIKERDRLRSALAEAEKSHVCTAACQHELEERVSELEGELNDERNKVGLLMQPVPEVHGDFPWQMMRLWCLTRDEEKRATRAELDDLRAANASLRHEQSRQRVDRERDLGLQRELRAELARMRPVVEAAVRWRTSDTDPNVLPDGRIRHLLDELADAVDAAEKGGGGGTGG